VAKMEDSGKSPQYTTGIMKVIRSWLAYNDIRLTRKIKIRNPSSTPTIENEQVPSQQELARIFRNSSARVRTAEALMAFSNLRPETLGNHDGSDGLKIADLPEMRIENRQVTFDKIPTRIIVRAPLSKTRQKYFTFLSSEGCSYLQEYLDSRIREGQELKPDSPLL